MRNKQLIQLLRFILGWVLLGLFVVFVMEKSFIDFILKYWLYLLILSISYFYYYSIEYEPDEKYKLIRNVVIYGNVYLFLHIFFRPLLNISHQLFVLLGFISLGMWRTTTLRSNWKYLLQILGGIFSFFILISGMLYFYPDEPDIEGFLESRNNEIRIIGVIDSVDKEDAYIKMSNLRGVEDFEIRSNFSKNLSENVRISYPSLKKQRDEKVIVITPQGDLIWIFPQSEIQTQFDGESIKSIEKLNGEIGFLSGVFESNFVLSGIDKILSQEEQDWLKGVQEIYKYELVSYLKNQISENNMGWANNTIMYNIDGIIIKFLAKMFPVTFSKNLHNYNEFQKYFGRIEDGEVDLGRFSMQHLTGESISSFLGNLEDNLDAGKSNTYGWFKKPEKR